MPLTRHVERHFTSGQTVRDIVIGMSKDEYACLGQSWLTHCSGTKRPQASCRELSSTSP
jgi:hypothetical protein